MNGERGRRKGELNMPRNSHCDYDNCTDATGQVRLLPTGGGGNAILCYACYCQEMTWRRERNKERTIGAVKFDIPNWTDLKIYAVE
jgi:hypothetical protein